jgi:hypothetical protein
VFLPDGLSIREQACSKQYPHGENKRADLQSITHSVLLPLIFYPVVLAAPALQSHEKRMDGCP